MTKDAAMTNLTEIGHGWDLLEACGEPINPEFADKWFGGKIKGEWLMSRPLGFAATLDHRQVIGTLFLFAKGVEGKNKPFTGKLPGDLSWSTTRAEVNELFGQPERSGEPTDVPATSVFYSPYAWDRWAIDTRGFIRVEYQEGDVGIRSIQLQQPEQPEPTSVELQVYADYYQFYVADTANTCDTSVIWDDPQASERQIAIGEGLVAVGTKRYGFVPVNIECYPFEPKLDPEGIDRINECGIAVTKSLGVGNYISVSPLAEVPLSPGTYAVRILYSFQDQVTDDQTGNDRYTVQLWPATELPSLRYLKPK
jgi:hypothetical protein